MGQVYVVLVYYRDEVHDKTTVAGPAVLELADVWGTGAKKTEPEWRGRLRRLRVLRRMQMRVRMVVSSSRALLSTIFTRVRALNDVDQQVWAQL